MGEKKLEVERQEAKGRKLWIIPHELEVLSGKEGIR